MSRPRVVALTGAGISAESGLKTFRASDGLWENHRIEDVATPEAWRKNPELVLTFYNERRKASRAAKPNRGHQVLADMQSEFEVIVITQNVDDLHERAGSGNVIHLHGSLLESRSTTDPHLIYQIAGDNLFLGDRCEKGSQLRPNIVWFGEGVPKMEIAAQVAAMADYFIVAGTSLQVYPAAGLIHEVPDLAPVFVVDPNSPKINTGHSITYFDEPATTGMDKVWQAIRKSEI